MVRKISLYGKIGIETRYCRKCNQEVFVINNILQCCERQVEPKQGGKIELKRISVPPQWRRKKKRVSNNLKKKILIEQGWKCAYCGVDLHTIKINFDHFIPFSFIADSRAENIIATCRDCNCLKSSKIFTDVGQASNYVKGKSLKRKTTRKLLLTLFPENLENL